MTQARKDALASAQMRAREERSAIATLTTLGLVDGADMRYAVRSLAEFEALIARLTPEDTAIELTCLRCAHSWEADMEPGWEAICPACGESDYIPRSIGA